jgi:thymidylate kinase
MKSAETSVARKRDIPRIVEIVGPAGAGKTTLCQILNNYQELIQLTDFPDVHQVGNAPFYIRHGLGLVFPLARLYQRTSRQLSRREFAWLSVMRGWASILEKEAKKSSKVILLDQGPVYLIAEMQELGPKYLGSPKAEKFWQFLYYQWANTLDMVVYLDTDDKNLLERIRYRGQEHIMKSEQASTVFDFLAGYRRAYERILAILEANTTNLQVLRFDTSKMTSQEIADRLLAQFGF